jgi:hypothetical protein
MSYTVPVGESIELSAYKTVEEPFLLITNATNISFNNLFITGDIVGDSSQVMISVPPYLPSESVEVRVVSCILDELSCSVVCGEIVTKQILTDNKNIRGGKAVLFLRYGAQELSNYWPSMSALDFLIHLRTK